MEAANMGSGEPRPSPGFPAIEDLHIDNTKENDGTVDSTSLKKLQKRPTDKWGGFIPVSEKVLSREAAQNERRRRRQDRRHRGRDYSSTSRSRSSSRPSTGSDDEEPEDEYHGSAQVPPPDVVWKFSVFRKMRGKDICIGTFRYNKPTDIDTPDAADSDSQYDSDGQMIPAKPKKQRPIFEIHREILERTVVERGHGHHSDILGPARRVPQSLDDLKVHKVTRLIISINSEDLIEVLRGSIDYYPEWDDLWEATRNALGLPLEIPEPFAFLLHHFEAMKNYLANPPEQTSTIDGQPAPPSVKNKILHTQRLYDFLKDIHARCVPAFEKEMSQPEPATSYDMIWYLFRPGTTVYMRRNGSIRACVVSRVKSNLNRKEWTFPGHVSDHWRIECWELTTDGNRVGRSGISCTIMMYSGSREVTSLPVCPVEIWDKKDGGARRNHILQRNRLFFDALRNGHMLVEYDGPNLDNQQQYRGNIVLDHLRAVSHGKRHMRLMDMPGYELEGGPNSKFTSYDYIYTNEKALAEQGQGDTDFGNDFDPDLLPIPQPLPPLPIQNDGRRRGDDPKYFPPPPPLPRPLPPVRADFNMANEKIDPLAKERFATTEITEHQLLLLAPETCAFALRSKTWMTISTDNCSRITESTNSINNLILDPQELKTIRALSERQHSKNKAWSADFIEGKGSGQVILLHGPPGVGKTYTVESIAEWLERPLLALTVTDIGTEETKIESELIQWFDLAEAWNAVLLVDEADIFLEQRKNRDLARNGLVTAFLRRMEYFKGLLFLTTNRVGQIDDAFISRVHVAIGYNKLDAPTRRKIWTGFFNKLSKEREGRLQVGRSAKNWVLDNTPNQSELNGRDIRNALQTAIALAEFEATSDPDYKEGDQIVVEQGHFERVLDINQRFQKYVASIRREGEAKRAFGRGDRRDYPDSSDGDS